MARRIYDVVLLADGQRVAIVVDDGEVTCARLSRSRLTPEAAEELAQRMRDGDFDTTGEDQ